MGAIGDRVEKSYALQDGVDGTGIVVPGFVGDIGTTRVIPAENANAWIIGDRQSNGAIGGQVQLFQVEFIIAVGGIPVTVLFTFDIGEIAGIAMFAHP